MRENVDAAYDKIVNAMFETLKAMAKMDGDEEDKSQLNYHVVIIGGFYFIFERDENIHSLSSFREHALLYFGNGEDGGWIRG